MKYCIEKILKDSNLKITEHRVQILTLLINTKTPLSSEEIFFSLKKSKLDVNLSTVYRTLEKMESLKIVEKSALTGEKSAVYSILKNNGHQHFIKCSDCGKITPINNCPFEVIEKSIEKNTGYIVEGHDFTFSGKCEVCRLH